MIAVNPNGGFNSYWPMPFQKSARIEVVAITASPCGGCRQWLYEFKVDRVVFPSAGDLVTRTTAELLPDAWDDL